MPITGQRLDELGIPMMVDHNTSRFTTAFTVSVEAKHKISTGISAADRAQTVCTLIDPNTKPGDIVYPGHMFPLRAKEGGVLVRAGHTEAIIDMAKLSGLIPQALFVKF
jgi:3,4-dihydroxy 2-butanone 4-phosphate synthase/GTP cyclohydrolase II